MFKKKPTVIDILNAAISRQMSLYSDTAHSSELGSEARERILIGILAKINVLELQLIKIVETK